jgi:hypothetical protein
LQLDLQAEFKSTPDNSIHKTATMSEGKILKPDKDFSKEVDKQLPEAEQLAQVC